MNSLTRLQIKAYNSKYEALTHGGSMGEKPSKTVKTPKELYQESRKLTIPNVLTCMRIVMIPVFIWLYSFEKCYESAALVLLISGLTDILDGFIARKFNMMSDLGKFLDPLADKLTQAAILVVLSARYPLMMLIFIMLFVKEIYAFYDGYRTVEKTGVVLGSQWHGKALTVLIYTMLLLHAFWFDIPELISNLLMAASLVMLVVSGMLYHLRNQALIKNKIN